MIIIVLCIAISVRGMYLRHKEFWRFDIACIAILGGLMIGIFTAGMAGIFFPKHEVVIETQAIQCSEKTGQKICIYQTKNSLQFYLVQKNFGAGIVSKELFLNNPYDWQEEVAGKSAAILETYTTAFDAEWHIWFALPMDGRHYRVHVPKGSIKQVSEIKTTGETP